MRLLETELYGVPAWISFSCQDESRTNHLESFASECVPMLATCPQIAAIGINCTAPKYLERLLRDAQAAIDASSAPHRPVLLCYPNSGEVWDCDGRCWKSGQVGHALHLFMR